MKNGYYSGEAPRPASRRVGWALILAGLLVLLVGGLVTGWRVVNHARSLRAHLAQLEAWAASRADGSGLGSLQAAGLHLAGMREDVAAIGGEVGWLLPAGRLLGWAPKVGGDLAAAPNLLQMAYWLAAAGDRTFQALGPALEQGQRAVPALDAARPALQAARRELDAAAQARAQIDAGRLSPQAAGLVARVDAYLPVLQMALEAATLAPDLLGAGEPRTYLILAQNNHELRATGGFISGVGELRLEEGQIGSMQFADSYTVDNFEAPHELAPADLKQTLYGELWFFRDANWDADFPTSARRAMEIYHRDRGVQADGVLSLDLTALQLLVEAVGPLAVEGLDEPVTGASVLQVVQDAWGGPSDEAGQDWWAHRKDFMGQIAAAALARLMSGAELDQARLLEAINRSLAEKHMLLYSTDPAAAALLRQANWDGALDSPGHGSDLLMVVDSNVGFNKMDARVARSIRYRVDLGAPEGPLAELTLTYHNESDRPVGNCVQESRYGDSYAHMMERCYWDYVRVHVPGGSRLLDGPDLSWPPGSLAVRNNSGLSGEPFDLALDAGPWAVWTGFFALEPGGTLTLTYRYQLPATVLAGEGAGVRYQLDVQKQPGTDAHPLQVEVVLPPGATLVEASPAELPSVSTDLRTDQAFQIRYLERGQNP